ncbi:MAG: GlsB/YeaQ/YmgE family stress response membrane protein [Chloroflexi bacterium]|nr:GlsB/YeaQ/YmgE family stress response membrane protein [Chloroflexota bacterium]
MQTVVLITLSPGGIIAWIIVGLIAGWLAGKVMSGGGYGIIGDVVIGLIGAFLGGIIVSLFTSKTVGLIGSIVVAFIGACVLVALLHLIRGESIRT